MIVEGIEPKSDRRIATIFVWVAVHRDGGEGIISADVPGLVMGETRHTPLMSSIRTVADGLEPLASEVIRLSRRAVRAELREFRWVMP
jgi:hypothetical protein